MTATEFYSLFERAAKKYPQHAARIHRGRDILRNHLLDPSRKILEAQVAGDVVTFRVRSQVGNHGYHVDAHGCTCPDWPRSGRCKHYVAVKVFCKMQNITLGAIT